MNTKELKILQVGFLTEYKIKMPLKYFQMILECKENKDFKPIFETDLYKNKGCQYCRLLQYMNKY
jgi:coenzyme F420-reducing hydrogenase beta subunit